MKVELEELEWRIVDWRGLEDEVEVELGLEDGGA